MLSRQPSKGVFRRSSSGIRRSVFVLSRLRPWTNSLLHWKRSDNPQLSSDHRDPKGSLVQKEPRVTQDRKESREYRAIRETLDQQDQQVLKVLRESRERLDHKVLRVFKENLVLREKLARLEAQALLDHKELKGLRAFKERRVLKESKGFKEFRETSDQQVLPGQMELTELLAQ